MEKENNIGLTGPQLSGLFSPREFANTLASSGSTASAVEVFNRQLENAHLKREDYTRVFKGIFDGLTELSNTKDIEFGGRVDIAHLKSVLIIKLWELRQS